MSARIEGHKQESLSDAAVAFEGMRRQLALLESAVAGFAGRQEDIHARDYAPELAQIIESQDKIAAGLRTLAERPAMALSPEALASEIEHAGAGVRNADHRTIHDSAARLDQAIGRINGVVENALTADRQKVWMVWAAAGGMAFGMLLWSFLPGSIARAMPESWHWPEAMAANMLARDGWDAGERLMQVADPERWRGMEASRALVLNNASAFAACRKRLRATKTTTVCRIKISRPRTIAASAIDPPA